MLFQCKKEQQKVKQQNNSRYLWIVIDSRIVALAALGIWRSHTETYISLHNSNYDHVLHDHISSYRYPKPSTNSRTAINSYDKLLNSERCWIEIELCDRSIAARYNWMKHIKSQTDTDRRTKKFEAIVSININYQAIKVTFHHNKSCKVSTLQSTSIWLTS